MLSLKKLSLKIHRLHKRYSESGFKDKPTFINRSAVIIKLNFFNESQKVFETIQNPLLQIDS